jgi:hypothetical protein
LEEQRALNVRTIKARVDGLSEEDLQTMKRSIAEETSRSKWPWRPLMRKSRATPSFEQAWKDGNLYQKALFPARLTWFQNKRAFETSQTVSIDDIETFFSQLDNFGVPDGIEPVGLQNGPLIPKYLGHANH